MANREEMELRLQAFKRGERTYVRGRPCRHCGTDEYRVSSAHCAECDRRYHRTGDCLVERNCWVCGKPFAIWSHSRKIVCSPECRNKRINWLYKHSSPESKARKAERTRFRYLERREFKGCAVCGGLVGLGRRTLCSEECAKLSKNKRVRHRRPYKPLTPEQKERQRRWRMAHPGYNREWRHKNPDQIRELDKAYDLKRVAARRFLVQELGMDLGSLPKQGVAAYRFLRELGINLKGE